MDTSDPDIQFDAQGVCNHCRMYDGIVAAMPPPEAAAVELQAIAQRIKEAGRSQRYDCIVGVSGGVDSSYVAYQARQLGLRPLAVHFDNGWNSERAEHNIEMVVRGLDLDLFTYVVDWEEFRDLQRSFFRASVIDIEMLTDHAIAAVTLRAAASRGIHYILREAMCARRRSCPRPGCIRSWTCGASGRSRPGTAAGPSGRFRPPAPSTIA